MENSVCKISWKLIENWRRNRRNSSTTVNVNPGIVTCITNLRKIHEKLFKLSRPQVNVNADATTPNFNCNSPPFLIKIKRRAKKHSMTKDGYDTVNIMGLFILLYELIIYENKRWPGNRSSSSKSLLYVTFRHKRSFKWHYNTIKTL